MTSSRHHKVFLAPVAEHGHVSDEEVAMEAIIYAVAAGLFVVLLFLPARGRAVDEVVDWGDD